VILEGSFRWPVNLTFSALDAGHADAVAQAIQWLAQYALPDAIAQDHKLHDENACPKHGFGRWVLDRPMTTAQMTKAELEVEVERLRETEWKYKELCR